MLLDVFTAVLILFFVIRGLFSGLLRQLFWLAGVVCAGFLAFTLYRPAGATVAAWTGLSTGLARFLALALLFLVILGVFLFVGRMFTAAAKKLRLSAANRVLGAAFGAAIGVLISGVLAFAVRSVLAQAGRARYVDDTVLARPVMELAERMLSVVE